MFLFCVPLLYFAFEKAGTPGSARLNEGAPARPELVLQTGHSKGVTCGTFGPDDNWLASGGADNSIRIWQVATGRELRVLTGHTGTIKSLATSPNGQWLASSSNDRTVKIWEVATGREVYSWAQGTSVEALAFSPDNRRLVSGGADKTIRIWDLTIGREVRTLIDHTGSVTALAFSRNGKELVSGSADSTVKLWDPINWQVTRTLRKHAGKITALAFNSDDSSFASASSDGAVLIWPVGSDHERLTIKRNASSVLAVGFGSNASVAVAHTDGGLEFWDPANGKEIRVVAGDPNSEQLVFAAFSSNTSTLASSEGSRVVSLRSLTTNEELKSLESHATAFNAVDFSRDGRLFAAAANDSSIRLWHVGTGRELPRLSGHRGYVNTVAFSPDNHHLASGSGSGEVKVWDADTGLLAFSLPTSTQGINAVVFSPDGKFLAAAGMLQTIEVWDLDTRQGHTIKGSKSEITSLLFSSDGQLLVSGGRDKTVRVWNSTTGDIVRTLENGDADINCLALSPDGKLLAAGASNKTIRIWDFSSGAQLQVLNGHADEVLKVAFSPDGQLLASGSSDRNAKIWDLKSGHELRTLTGSSGNVNGVAFTNDGLWLITANEDGSMMVWSSGSGTLAATLVSVPNSDDWLVAAPDGLFDGSAVSWNLLLWRFGGDTFNALPVEAYFNEFFRPGLLADILNNKDPKAAQDITQKDRRQPRINLALSDGARTRIDGRQVKIKLEITEAKPDKDHASGSGARDVRLFRNGLLIKVWQDDVLKGANQQTLEASIPVVAGENRLSAYAFNNDDIKSMDASLSLSGADSLKRIGTAYLLAIGVEQYENTQYNLHYPVADAEQINAQLKNQQEQLGRYKPVVTVPLLNADATKRNILLSLKRLSGEDADLPPGSPAALADIKKAQPEDVVVIYFSGHGTAYGDRFYLIPNDLGYKGVRTPVSNDGLTTILAHSISDKELEEALRPLDADQLLLVVDACNSGQALTAEEKRRGPMNTRGLAQLAYEKGMYILTASQSNEVAFESEQLKHSYLAFALIEDGIKSGCADLDHDGQITLREWFAFASERVPQIRRERYKTRKELIEDDPNEQKVQRPIPFYTRDSGAKKLVIARVAKSNCH